MQLRIEEKTQIDNKSFSQSKHFEQTGLNPYERFDPPALALDERGMILDCSKSFEKLFGFRRSDLVWHHVSTLFSQLDGVELVKAGQVNSLLSYLCRCGQLYEAKNREGKTVPSSLNFVRLEYEGKRILRLIVQPFPGSEFKTLV